LENKHLQVTLPRSYLILWSSDLKSAWWLCASTTMTGLAFW